MGTPHHQQSLHRKVLYIGLILLLFFGLVFYRSQVLEAAAQKYNPDRGDVELTGKVVTLGLTGLRGVVVTGLWWGAKEKMEKNQWNELELLVRSVTRLQPHFITPWVYQSWNLSYNVAVKCDRELDQYFYITRGIELLAEGERQNPNIPEIRFEIGRYNQDKIQIADRTSMLKVLYQMSCIDPVQRDPRRFRKPDAQGHLKVDLSEFEKFCQEHPQMVRQLREKLRCETPEDVVQFLDENRRVPCLYEDDPERMKRPWRSDEQSRMQSYTERFPQLPPGPSRERLDQRALTQDSQLEDHTDAFTVARAWYSYAAEPLPDPSWIPGRYQPLKEGQRLPRFTTQIFRNQPARAQSHVAERLEEDGWFDETGWRITRWFLTDPVVGGGRKWASEAWGEAYQMWFQIGERHGLNWTAEREHDLRKKADNWAELHKVSPTMIPPDIPEEEVPDEGMKAWILVTNYDFYRNLTNFPHFLHEAQVLAMPQSVEARKHFHQAKEAIAAGDRRQAIEEFELALPAYRQILKDHPGFRTDRNIAEETLDLQWTYLNLCRELYGRPWKQAQTAAAFIGLAASGPAPVPDGLPLAQLGRTHLLPDIEMKGPLDEVFGDEVVGYFTDSKNPKKKNQMAGMSREQMMMEMRKRQEMGMMDPKMRPQTNPTQDAPPFPRRK